MVLLCCVLVQHRALGGCVQGVCKNGVCVCTQGYRGDYCEIAPACPGILDSAGNCCQSGVVSSSGQCCSPVSMACELHHTASDMPEPADDVTMLQATATLDQFAHCCASGKMDACGVCDGTGLLVDVQVRCKCQFEPDSSRATASYAWDAQVPIAAAAQTAKPCAGGLLLQRSPGWLRLLLQQQSPG